MSSRIPIADLSRVLKTGIVRPAAAKKKRADRGGYDSYAEQEFARNAAGRDLRYHWLRVRLDGGTTWTPDFVSVPPIDYGLWVGVAAVTVTRDFRPHGVWTAYEVQAAPWRTKSGKLGRHQSKRAQSIVLREVRATFPWLHIVVAEKQRGGGFLQKAVS